MVTNITVPYWYDYMEHQVVEDDGAEEAEPVEMKAQSKRHGTSQDGGSKKRTRPGRQH